MKKLLFKQSFLKLDILFSQFANKRLKRTFAKPHYFVSMYLQNYHGYIMFTGLSFLYNVYRIIMVIYCLQDYPAPNVMQT